MISSPSRSLAVILATIRSSHCTLRSWFRIQQHLQDCGMCRNEFEAYHRTLQTLRHWPTPPRPPSTESQVWRRISDLLPPKPQSLWSRIPSRALGMAAAIAAIAIVSLLVRPAAWRRTAGRLSRWNKLAPGGRSGAASGCSRSPGAHVQSAFGAQEFNSRRRCPIRGYF